MQRVLLSTDFSENARHAIEYALLIFGNDGVQYFLFNSYSLQHNIPETLISLEDILHQQSEKGLKQNVDNLVNHHEHLNIKTISTYGDAPVAIKKVADDRGIDLVVLGSHGNKALRDTLFGSTTLHLVNKIQQPMLIVPLGYKQVVPKKIVLATDLKQVKDLNILEPMLLVARRYGAQVVIMNVTGKADHFPIRKALRRLDFNNHFNGIKFKFEVVTNKNVVRGISDFIENEKVDMLVLLPKQYPNFKSMFHHSVTKRMIKNSGIPILVV